MGFYHKSFEKMDVIRQKLHDAILDSREDMQSLSIKVGKNRTYLQQYIRRSQPKHLPAEVAMKLGQLIKINWQEFVSPDLSNLTVSSQPNQRSIAELDVRAAAGPGALNEVESPIAYWGFPSETVQVMGGNIDDIRIIRVDGDSMEPALYSGDRVAVDCTRRAPSPPGIYVLYDGAGLIIKRLESMPDGMVKISSENSNYSTTTQPLDALDIKGRVVWMSRAI